MGKRKGRGKKPPVSKWFGQGFALGKRLGLWFLEEGPLENPMWRLSSVRSGRAVIGYFPKSGRWKRLVSPQEEGIEQDIPKLFKMAAGIN